MQSTLPQNNWRKNRGFAGYAMLLVAIVLSAALLYNRQLVVDAISYVSFKPSADVAQIAARDGLTDAGKFLFYADDANVETGAAFNKQCVGKESGTAILGCYVNDHIYIYNVTDSRLDGIEEVTAAHELLHAAYQRLSLGQRATVDKLVEAEYDKLKDNPQFSERMAYYARTEPGERDNELHSIIGTEVASISPALETYYGEYFKDRAVIVALHSAYNGVFTSLASQAKAISAQLSQLNKKITDATNQYNGDTKTLNADIATFNSRARGGSFASPAEFEMQRQALQNRVSALSVERTNVNNLIKQYNSLCETYNNTVTQSNNLYQSIDSRLVAAPKVQPKVQ